MQEAFQNGIDLHRLTASSVTGTEIEQVTDSQRQAAKIMNEYHLSRASAPILPTWIWKYHRDRLNKVWHEYRAID